MLRAMTTKLTVLKIFVSLIRLVKIWGQLDFRWCLRILLYPWGVKKPFVGKWIEVVCLAVMSQCRVLIFVWFFELKSYLLFILFYFFHFFLFVGSYGPPHNSLVANLHLQSQPFSFRPLIPDIQSQLFSPKVFLTVSKFKYLIYGSGSYKTLSIDYQI